ncbi:hypothetical protein SGGMMB4_03805 [Sodalis glossinidius str. 'morsitans']|uniref:Uncharacterized protein n=1 Tax=Sodalis glossinidius (strain morsitans) TaxID=343509 RepID=A0A193QKR2_SODGM|nr:hypothetical protein SGGMMB4_03805 [Sodalis glossinidius str. 'morsitans']
MFTISIYALQRRKRRSADNPGYRRQNVPNTTADCNYFRCGISPLSRCLCFYHEIISKFIFRFAIVHVVLKLMKIYEKAPHCLLQSGLTFFRHKKTALSGRGKALFDGQVISDYPHPAPQASTL